MMRRIVHLIWPWALATLFLAALGIVVSAFQAVAAEVPAVPSTEVVIAWGDLVASQSGTIQTVLLGVALWMVRQLPAQVWALVSKQRVEQLLAMAVRYGCNVVAGAAPGRTLTVDVGNAVVAEALRYALARIPARLLEWVGGEARLAEMIVARLDLSPAAHLPGTSILNAGKPDPPVETRSTVPA